MTRLLVLGGSSFVGRALVEAGVARGWEVTTFNRGRGAWAHPGVERLIGDRDDPDTLGVLDGREWDVVADTWSGAPRAAQASAAVLRERVERYVYISSCSVYAPPPMEADEATPTVDASAGDGPEVEDYARRKRGSELAIEEAFGDRALLLRPGLILGPHEDVGRLPWWLSRLARGGEVLAPGPADQPLQMIDARDLATFALDAAAAGRSGAYNMVSRRGHLTMRSFLEAGIAATGADARLTWVSPALIAEHEITGWIELPVWLSPDDEYAGLHANDVEKAYAAGFAPRPVEETVADTWAWLRSLDGPPPTRTDIPSHGLAPEKEAAALAAHHAAAR